MGGICSMYGSKGKLTQNFGGKTRRKESTLET
jgi:hypothetical protein